MVWTREICREFYRKWVATVKSRKDLADAKEIIRVDKSDPRGALVLFGPMLDELLELVLRDFEFPGNATVTPRTARPLLRLMYRGAYQLNTKISASRVQAVYRKRHLSNGTCSGLLLPLAGCTTSYLPKMGAKEFSRTVLQTLEERGTLIALEGQIWGKQQQDDLDEIPEKERKRRKSDPEPPRLGRPPKEGKAGKASQASGGGKKKTVKQPKQPKTTDPVRCSRLDLSLPQWHEELPPGCWMVRRIPRGDICFHFDCGAEGIKSADRNAVIARILKTHSTCRKEWAQFLRAAGETEGDYLDRLSQTFFKGTKKGRGRPRGPAAAKRLLPEPAEKLAMATPPTGAAAAMPEEEGRKRKAEVESHPDDSHVEKKARLSEDPIQKPSKKYWQNIVARHSIAPAQPIGQATQPAAGGDRDASQVAARSQGSAGEGSQAHQHRAASDASTPAPRRSGWVMKSQVEQQAPGGGPTIKPAPPDTLADPCYASMYRGPGTSQPIIVLE